MTNTTTPTITRVDLTWDEENQWWSVRPIWADVDRPDVGGWALRNKRTAERLRAALLAGVVYSKTEFCTDTGGKTYVHGTSKVMSKYANADLRRLGY